jgi:hypothetical protein|tara:strand:+ start:2684 stop:3460 length:777 start_codon:yes stop_codon:yes gene_type:complete
MTIHLRQLCLVASELEPVVEQLTGILGINVCHIDPGVEKYGLRNVLLPIGTDFLEVVAPLHAETAAGRYLQKMGGNAGYMVIVQTDNRATQIEARQRAIDAGIRIAHEEDRIGWSFCQLHPADMVTAFLDIEWDQQQEFAGCWHPAGELNWKEFVDQQLCKGIIGVELRSDKPGSVKTKWEKVLGEGNALDDGEHSLQLSNAMLRFVELSDTSSPGLSGIDLRVNDKQAILNMAERFGCIDNTGHVCICGIRFYLHQW